MTLLYLLNDVEPLAVVASLTLAVAVLIYQIGTQPEAEPLRKYARVINWLARYLLIPLAVIGILVALAYVCFPNHKYLTYLSFSLICLSLLIVLIFWLFVIPRIPKGQRVASIYYAKSLFENAQSDDIQALKKYSESIDDNS